MSREDERHVALPALYGAPAYARPPKPIPEAERPFDPDELPIEAHQTEEERAAADAARAAAEPPGGNGATAAVQPPPTSTPGRRVTLRFLAERMRGPES